jgi:hypothetical protein
MNTDKLLEYYKQNNQYTLHNDLLHKIIGGDGILSSISSIITDFINVEPDSDKIDANLRKGARDRVEYLQRTLDTRYVKKKAKPINKGCGARFHKK